MRRQIIFMPKRVWLAYGAATLLLGALAIGLDQNENAADEIRAHAEASQDLQLLRLAVQEQLDQGQFQSAARLLNAWGAANPDIIELALNDRNEALVGQYRRANPAAHFLSLTATLSYDYNGRAALRMVHDLDPVIDAQTRFGWRLLRAYLVLCATAAALIALILRRRQALEQLREANGQLDNYFNHALDLFCIADLNGRLLRVNARWFAVLGYTDKELHARPLLDLVDAGDREATGEVLERVAQKEAIHNYTNHCRHKDGSMRTIEWVIQPGDGVFYGAARDITEREKGDNEIRFLNRIYSTLSEANQLIDRCVDEKSLFENICRVAVQSGGMQLAWIGKEEESSHRIVPVAATGEALDILEQIVISTREDLPEGRGPAGKAYRDGKPRYYNDWKNNADLLYWHVNQPQWIWGSSAAVPILRGGRTYALLSLYHRQAAAFSGKTIDLLQEMARDIELALERFDFAAHRRSADEALRIAAIAFESQDAMIVTDIDGNILRANRAFSEETGYAQEELIGKNTRLMRSGRHSPAFFQAMWDQIKATGQWQGEIWDKRKNGEIYPNWLSISSVRDPHGAITHYVGCFSDISERKEAAAAISRLAYFDSLTELPNRRLLVERLKQALSARARHGGYGAVLFLDVDNFKTVNDTLGHEQGDRLLQEIAKRLRASVHERGTLARFGGDEYVLLLEDLDGPRERAAVLAKAAADVLQAAMVAPFAQVAGAPTCSASIGIVLWGSEPGVPDAYELLKRSDMAMYEAKRAGRNAVRFFDPIMQTTIESRVRLEARLRSAIGLGQLRLYLQPQVDGQGTILGAEALLRWLDPERGLIGPGEFIAIAEESGLIVGIGSWVLESACALLRAWARQETTRSFRMSVNISPRQIQEENFVAQLADIISRTGADPRQLQLEITENLLLSDVEKVIVKMTELRALGVTFAMDDFGTGYSSLSYLQRLPLNVLKIDQGFVRELGSNRRSEAIARTILQMGHSMGLEVLAEGVETERQLRMLAQWGCERFQGYYFGRPMPAEVFAHDVLRPPVVMVAEQMRPH